jgi:multidrug efflux pump subunit AcrA (membrane-fusion protein)
VQACVLAYALVRVIEDRLDAANVELNAKDALQDLARIQRAPLTRAGVTVTKTSTPTEQHRQLLAALGAPIPERHAAL